MKKILSLLLLIIFEDISPAQSALPNPTNQPGVRGIFIYTHDESLIGADLFTQEISKETFNKVFNKISSNKNPSPLESSYDFLKILDNRCDIQINCKKDFCSAQKPCDKISTCPTCQTCETTTPQMSPRTKSSSTIQNPSTTEKTPPNTYLPPILSVSRQITPPTRTYPPLISSTTDKLTTTTKNPTTTSSNPTTSTEKNLKTFTEKSIKSQLDSTTKKTTRIPPTYLPVAKNTTTRQPWTGTWEPATWDTRTRQTHDFNQSTGTWRTRTLFTGSTKEVKGTTGYTRDTPKTTETPLDNNFDILKPAKSDDLQLLDEIFEKIETQKPKDYDYTLDERIED